MGVRVGAYVKVCTSLLAGLGPLLSADRAVAQQNWEVPGLDTVGAGAFLGYAFGGERGLEWGFEAFGTHYAKDVSDCGADDRMGFGPLLRLSLLGTSRLAVTAALHAGRELARPLAAIDAELGASIAYQRGGARGSFHTGLALESLYLNLYARQDWLLPSYSVGGGIRVQPTFGWAGICQVGRLFRGSRGRAQLARVQTARSFDLRCPHAQRWSQRAGEECASVLSFLQLARELAQLGAPPALVARALTAANEELGHTHAAAELAALFGGAQVAVAPPAFPARPSLPRARALLRLAIESWHDGYVNEGLAASIARAELRETSNRDEAAALQQIQREETGHAALALDVLRWVLEQEPDLVRALQVPAESRSELATPTLLKRDGLRALAHDNRALARGRLRGLSSEIGA